jgi:methyl-accepting chemotaxis protein
VSEDKQDDAPAETPEEPKPAADEASKPAADEASKPAADEASKPAADEASKAEAPSQPAPEQPQGPSSADGGRGQRQVRNYLLQPPFQVQLVIYNCVLAFTFATAVVGVLWRIQARLANRMDAIGVPESLRDTLDSALGDSAIYLVILGLIFMVACASVTIILTHRLVGPAYAFRRQINELTSGTYTARIKLRENDAFTEVADDLNKLAETLERERGGLSSKGPILTMDD